MAKSKRPTADRFVTRRRRHELSNSKLLRALQWLAVIGSYTAIVGVAVDAVPPARVAGVIILAVGSP